MKIKVADLYNLSFGLNELSRKELPIALAFKIQRAQKKVSEELIASDKVRQSLIEKYKEKELDNGAVQIKKDKLNEFNEKINELMAQEIDLDIEKINIDDLEKSVEKVKPQTLMQLETILNAE